MANKARHAFGDSSGVEAAIQAGKIDAYDILFLDGDTEPKVGWIDRDGVFRLVKNEVDLSEIQDEIATKADAEEIEALETKIASKVDADTVKNMIEEQASSLIEVIEF